MTLVSGTVQKDTESGNVTGNFGSTGSDKLTKDSELSEVAFSGSYTDLSNKPDIPGEAPVQSVNGRDGDVTGLAEQTSLDQETSQREDADLELATNLSSEALIRSNADTNLQGAIDNINATIVAWFDTKYGTTGWTSTTTYVNSSLAGKTFFVQALSKETGGIPAYQDLRSVGVNPEVTINPSGGFTLSAGWEAETGQWYRILGVGVVPADVVSQIQFNELKDSVDSILNSIFPTQTGEFTISDNLGNIGLKLTGQSGKSLLETFTVSADTIKANTVDAQNFLQVTSNLVNGVQFSNDPDYFIRAVDPEGNVGGYIDKDLNLVGFTVDGTGSVVDYSKFDRDIDLNPGGGQSLEEGVEGQPALSTTQRFNSLMPVGGLRISSDPSFNPATYFTSAIPLVESNYSTNYGETSTSGLSEAYYETVQKQDKISLADIGVQQCFFLWGFQGRRIVQLKKGTVYYNNMIAGVTNLTTSFNAAGKTVGVTCIPFTQGEADAAADTDPNVWAAETMQLLSDATTDINAIVKQTRNIKLLGYQLSSSGNLGKYPFIALKQLELGLIDNNNYFVCTPHYIFPYADNLHLTNIGYRRYGFYRGYVKKQVLSGVDWKPLHVKSYVYQSNIIELIIKSPNDSAIVFDTTLVSSIANSGFNLVNASNVPVTISSVTIPRKNIIKIISATPISAGFKLTYAIGNGTGTSSGPTAGPRGNIRDSMGDDVVIVGNGENFKLHNWLCHTAITF